MAPIAENSVDLIAGGNVTKRLQNELMSLMMEPCHGITAFPENDDLLNWIGTITGPEGTVYDKRSYKVSMRFPQNYPFAPPQCRFETPIFHPNVDEKGGICLDILKDKWSAVYNVKTILLSIQALLEEPNNASPLNGEAARAWENRAEFSRIVAERTPGFTL